MRIKIVEITKLQILSLVYDSIQTINELRDEPDKLALSEDTLLTGRASKLDSLGLVNLVVSIEERFNERFGVEIVLTDERVMMQGENVFENVKTLADYIASVV
jgi:acyl carrier protein